MVPYAPGSEFSLLVMVGLIGAILAAVVLPFRIGGLWLQRRLIKGESAIGSLRVAVALTPTLIFTPVLAAILRERFGISDTIYGGLLVYTAISTALPSFLLAKPIDFDVASFHGPPLPPEEARNSKPGGLTMNLRTLLLVVFLAAITVFALVNWTAFTTPTTLSLVLGSVQAPLGLLMLVLTGLLAVLFLVYIAYQQAGTIAAARRGAREMAAQRELADAAEASRFTELRTYLEAELRKLDTRIGESRDQAVRRIDAAEQALGARLAEATNGLAAHLGEVEDKLDRSSSARG